MNRRSHTFVAILRYDKKSCTFVVILYQKDAILQNFLPRKEILCKKLCAVGRHFPSKEEISSHKSPPVYLASCTRLPHTHIVSPLTSLLNYLPHTPHNLQSLCWADIDRNSSLLLLLTACNAAPTAIDTRGDIACRVEWPGYRYGNVASLSLVEIGTGNVVFKKMYQKLINFLVNQIKSIDHQHFVK